MGWWINKLSGYGYFNDIRVDAIFQSTNVVFTCGNKHYDTYDIYALWCSGVNVFNVDRTVHDEGFFDDIKTAITDAERLYDPEYYRPLGLSVTMSVCEPVAIDERVDIIILKDVTNKEVLREFKRQNLKSPVSLLLWLSTPSVEDIVLLIKFSDGLILNMESENYVWCHLIKLCREEFKPVFFSKEAMIQEYSSSGNDRQVVNEASQVVKWRLDGVVLVDSDDKSTTATLMVRALITSMYFVELGIKPDKDYSSLSLKVKTPVSPFLSVSMAACLAAYQSGASAILLLTATGRSARWLACASPPCHVLAITAREATTRRLHLYRKVMPLLYNKPRASSWRKECWNRIHFGTTFALMTSLFSNGAKLVVLAPSGEGAGYCDSFHIVSVPFRCEE